MRWIIVLVLVVGCGGDDSGSDSDAAAASTACGPSGLTCDTRTQICVVQTPVGPGENYVCLSVPSGCSRDRSCGCAGPTLCTGAFATCGDRDDFNTIACECPQCQ